MEHATSSESLEQALKLLEEAAKLKKEELKAVLSNKYSHLKTLVVETESSLAKSLTDARKFAVEAASHAKDVSVAKAREVAGDVDKSVHQNPWPFIGGTAIIAMLLGYVLGHKK